MSSIHFAVIIRHYYCIYSTSCIEATSYNLSGILTGKNQVALYSG